MLINFFSPSTIFFPPLHGPRLSPSGKLPALRYCLAVLCGFQQNAQGNVAGFACSSGAGSQLYFLGSGGFCVSCLLGIVYCRCNSCGDLRGAILLDSLFHKGAYEEK